MKIATLVKKFDQAVTLQHDGEDYNRTVAFLRGIGISPGAKAPTGQGIVPYLVHGSSGSKATTVIDWE